MRYVLGAVCSSAHSRHDDGQKATVKTEHTHYGFKAGSDE